MTTTLATLRDRVVSLAAAQVGMREKGGPNRGPPVDLYAGGRREPWCAHFIAWLFRHCGAPLPGDIEPSVVQHNPIAAVAMMWNELVNQGCQVYAPRPGDLVFFRSRVGSDAGAGWHVGLVIVVQSHLLQTIEGNSGDAVRRRQYRLGDKNIVGYARVPEPT